MSPSPRFSALAAAALALLARPAPGKADAATAPVIVLLAPDLEPSDVDDRAVGTLGARVRANGVNVVVVRRAVADIEHLAADSKRFIEVSGARGALWVDVGRPNEAALYLVTRDGEQVFGRTIAAPEGKTSATLETLANIAASVSAELLEGRIVELAPVNIPAPERPLERIAAIATPSIKPEPAPAPPPKPSAKADVASPPAPPPRPPRFFIPPPSPKIADIDRFPRLGFAVGYTGDSFGSTIPWQSAVSGLVTVSPSPNTFVGLGYNFVFPVHIDAFIGGYDLARHPIVALGGYRLVYSPWDFRLGGRTAMDIIEQTPDPIAPPPPPPHAPTSWRPPPPPTSRTEILFTAGPLLEVGYSFAGRFRAGAFLGIEILLNSPSPTLAPLDLKPDPARIITGLSLGVDLFVPAPLPRQKSAVAASNGR
ncbi:MAG: hypothetical protein HUU21_12845 [Polyangiaceae bacterium]|nr:hypothetical protein [Polyangiaceae bacterium]